jgi:hypothetical protein
MTWQKHSDGIYTLETTISLQWLGRTRTYRVAFRLDGRGGDGYRVDLKTAVHGSWCLPFEAIDGGQPVATVAAGKRYVAAYKRLARAENDLTITPTAVRAELTGVAKRHENCQEVAA